MPSLTFPTLSFLLSSSIAVFLVLLLRNGSARSVSSVALAFWLFLAITIHAVNAVLWIDSSDAARAPIWCDITTKVSIGALAAIPGACVGLARPLEHLASRRKFHPQLFASGAHRFIDLGCCIFFPVVYMLLHFAVQDHRFDVTLNLGCFPSMRRASSATTTMLVPPMLAGGLALGFCLGALIHAIILVAPRPHAQLSAHLEARMGYTYPVSAFVTRLLSTALLTLGALALSALTFIPDLRFFLELETSPSTTNASNITNTTGVGGFGVAGDPNTTATPLLQWDWSLAHVPILSSPDEVRNKQIGLWSLFAFGVLLLLATLAGGVGDMSVWPWATLGRSATDVWRNGKQGGVWIGERLRTAFKPFKRHTREPQSPHRVHHRPELSRITIPSRSPGASQSSASTSKLSLATPVSTSPPRRPPGLYSPRSRGEFRSGWDEMLEMDAYENPRSVSAINILEFKAERRDLDAEGISRTPSVASTQSKRSTSSPSPTRTRTTSPSSTDTLDLGAPVSPEDTAFAESTLAYLQSPVAHALGLASNTMSSQSPRRQRRDTVVIGNGTDGRYSVMSTPAPSPAPSTPPTRPPPLPTLAISNSDSPVDPPRTSSLPAQQQKLLTVGRVPPRQPIPTDTSDAGSVCSSIFDVPWPVPPPSNVSLSNSPVRSPLRSASVLRPTASPVRRLQSKDGLPLKPILKRSGPASL
ncbi:hypothetical protein MKEN_01428700 [Mycena kentingensis (nom. inval.)]|nr:hypothetical protein MKEN_01428700 [Mycena kentingensis (nom. inval.)]